MGKCATSCRETVSPPSLSSTSLSQRKAGRNKLADQYKIPHGNIQYNIPHGNTRGPCNLSFNILQFMVKIHNRISYKTTVNHRIPAGFLQQTTQPSILLWPVNKYPGHLFLNVTLEASKLKVHIRFIPSSNWWFAYDVIKNTIMQIMINLFQILIRPIRP